MKTIINFFKTLGAKFLHFLGMLGLFSVSVVQDVITSGMVPSIFVMYMLIVAFCALGFPGLVVGLFALLCQITVGIALAGIVCKNIAELRSF